MKIEIIKCASSPVYFISNYCYITVGESKTATEMLFKPFDYQKEVLKIIEEKDRIIVNKARQIGFTTLISLYALHHILFKKNRNVIAIATKQEAAKNIIKKVKYAYDRLPKWLKIDYSIYNRLELTLVNNSTIRAFASSGDVGRSETATMLIIDEAAMIKNIYEKYESLYGCVSDSGKLIIISTPKQLDKNPTGIWFKMMCTEAKEKRNDFHYIELDWRVRPDRDENWRRNKTKELGEKSAAQEYDCDFISTENTVVPGETIKFYDDNFVKPPLAKRGLREELWIWEGPYSNRRYMVTADVARGDGMDYQAFHVIDIDTVTQVAELKAQLSTTDYSALLVMISKEYNNAYLVVDNSGVGWSVVQNIITLGYDNLVYTFKNNTSSVILDSFANPGLMISPNVPGFTINHVNRPIMVNKLKDYFVQKLITVYSSRLMDELKNFVWNKGRPEAMERCNDDLVMALAMGLFVKDTILQVTLQNSGPTAVMASGREFYGYHSLGNTKVPPKEINVSGKKIDISWIY
ncbi:MAG: AAA family ATPase [Acidobacterium ailaaui]|nr:AAA family ATPase [Pseudacidobacterium ailaaui]